MIPPEKKSVRELLSALCSSAGQNLASISGRHSLSEAMLLFSVELLRLIGSQHEKFLLSEGVNAPGNFQDITLHHRIINQTPAFCQLKNKIILGKFPDKG